MRGCQRFVEKKYKEVKIVLKFCRRSLSSQSAVGRRSSAGSALGGEWQSANLQSGNCGVSGDDSRAVHQAK